MYSIYAIKVLNKPKDYHYYFLLMCCNKIKSRERSVAKERSVVLIAVTMYWYSFPLAEAGSKNRSAAMNRNSENCGPRS